jgi:opacity protein-like surface antigen
MHRLLFVIALALITMMDCAPGLAADPLGFYLGAGIGHSELRNNLGIGNFGPLIGFSGPYSASGHYTGWKLMTGIHPLPVLGAEVAYVDFGSVNAATNIPATPTQGGLNATATAHPRATALLAIGYLPIPLPHFDVFAKAGVAHLKYNVRVSGQGTCPTNLPCFPAPGLPLGPSLQSYAVNGTHPAYGAGAQLKLARLAVRAEYERVSAGSGDVDQLSLGLTFVF